MFIALRSIAFLALNLHSATYFYAYWSTEVVGSGLEFAIIYEIFQNILRPYASIRRIGSWLFLWSALVVMGIALVSAVDHGNESNALMTGIFMLERSIRVVQAGLLLFLFGFARALGLTWRHFVFGVALGLGIFVSSELALVTLRLDAGRGHDLWYVLLKPAAYNCSVMVWVAYLAQPKLLLHPNAAVVSDELRSLNRALREFIYDR